MRKHSQTRKRKSTKRFFPGERPFYPANKFHTDSFFTSQENHEQFDELPRKFLPHKQRYFYTSPKTSRHFCHHILDNLHFSGVIWQRSSVYSASKATRPSILLMGDLNSRTGKYSDSVCQERNNMITNDQSEFAICSTQRNSFDNELKSECQ